MSSPGDGGGPFRSMFMSSDGAHTTSGGMSDMDVRSCLTELPQALVLTSEASKAGEEWAMERARKGSRRFASSERATVRIDPGLAAHIQSKRFKQLLNGGMHGSDCK
jgi:hypothetical protein